MLKIVECALCALYFEACVFLARRLSAASSFLVVGVSRLVMSKALNSLTAPLRLWNNFVRMPLFSVSTCNLRFQPEPAEQKHFFCNPCLADCFFQPCVR